MLKKDVLNSDWNETFQEELEHQKSVSHKVHHSLISRSHDLLFRMGYSQRSENRVTENENLVEELISDRINFKKIPQFIDYNKFSNPFMTFKKKTYTETKPTMGNSSHLDTKTMPLLKHNDDMSTKHEGPDAKTLKDFELSGFKKAETIPAKPPPEPVAVVTIEKAKEPEKEVPKTKSAPVELVEVKPAEPIKDMKEVKEGMYYMSHLKQAIDNSPTMDQMLAKRFKEHVVLNHQNLHELLDAMKKEKPLGSAVKMELEKGLGKRSVTRQEQDPDSARYR